MKFWLFWLVKHPIQLFWAALGYIFSKAPNLPFLKVFEKTIIVEESNLRKSATRGFLLTVLSNTLLSVMQTFCIEIAPLCSRHYAKGVVGAQRSLTLTAVSLWFVYYLFFSQNRMVSAQCVLWLESFAIAYCAAISRANRKLFFRSCLIKVMMRQRREKLLMIGE